MSLLSIEYQTDLGLVNSPKYKDWALHLLCLEGEGGFLYNHKPMKIQRNSFLVITHTGLISEIWQSPELKVIFVAAEINWILTLLPANHYGIQGSIDLFEQPMIPISDADTERLQHDLAHIRERLEATDRYFYSEAVGAQMLALVYDIYEIHHRLESSREMQGDRTSYLVKQLIDLLNAGRAKTQRDVSYYANELNVSSKYLSDTVSRMTGTTVSAIISRYTISIILQYLNNSDLSISQIADIMKFSSASYFCRYCVKHLGINPSDYRSKSKRTK